jgi:hypothetical protein
MEQPRNHEPEIIIDADGIKVLRDTANTIKTDLDSYRLRSSIYDEETNLLFDGLLNDLNIVLEDDSTSRYIRLERDDVFALVDYFQSFGANGTDANPLEYVEQLSSILPPNLGING